MTRIPDSHRDLLDRPLIVSLATVMPDGQPQVTPVWADIVDGRVRINTVAGRQKHRNLEERHQATLLVVDSGDPMRWMEIRGEVSGISEDGGIEGIDKLAKDYLDVEPYPWHKPDDTRLNIYISPRRVVTGD